MVGLVTTTQMFTNFEKKVVEYVNLNKFYAKRITKFSTCDICKTYFIPTDCDMFDCSNGDDYLKCSKPIVICV